MPFVLEGECYVRNIPLKVGRAKDVKLSLPAADYELLDALEKAGITNERDIYWVYRILLILKRKKLNIFLVRCQGIPRQRRRQLMTF